VPCETGTEKDQGFCARNPSRDSGFVTIYDSLVMRILHVVPTYYPAVRYGGPIYSVHSLCRSLVAGGHEVHVLTTNIDGTADSEVPLDRAVDLDGVYIHYSRSPWLRRIYWSPRLAAQCRSMDRRTRCRQRWGALYPITARHAGSSVDSKTQQLCKASLDPGN
jgi:hypothetical protein